jgi:hypothetical protein
MATRPIQSATPIFAAALAFALASCADQPAPVTGPAGIQAAAASAQGNGKSSLDLVEEDFASGLLDRENGNRYREYAVSAPAKLPSKYRSSAIGKDATYSMVQMARDWDALSKSTKDEILNLRANGFGQLKETVETQHFVLHYTTQGAWAVPSQDSNRNGTPDFIDVAAQSCEVIWNTEIGQLGYGAPKGTPAQKFHVYFKDMPYYGYAVPENVELFTTSPVPQGTASAWIAVENDFYGFPRNDEDVTGREVIRSGALKVTQAHEFMHAVQFNINVYQSGWLMESHATWAEDAVYDAINDWHWYINRFLSTPDFPLFNRYVYGSAYFMNWLSETRGVDVMRQIWQAAKTNSTPDAVRIAALNGGWEDIKAFAPAEYLLDISDFTRDARSIIPNPVNFIRATHASYPVNVDIGASTKKVANRAPYGLGANFIDFLPGGSPTVTITFDGTDGYAWRAFVIATPAGGGSPLVMPVTLNASSAGSLTVTGLGSRWARLTLAPTIADRAGIEVPYSYGASAGAAIAAN